MLPATLPMFFMSTVSGHLQIRYGAKLPTVIGMLLLSLSLFWLLIFSSSTGYIEMVFGFILFGLGLPLAKNPMTTISIANVNKHERGLASGIVGQAKQLGNTIGLAVIGTLINVQTQNHFANLLQATPKEMQHDFSSLNVNALLVQSDKIQQLLANFTPDFIKILYKAATDSYLFGFKFGMLFAASIGLIGFLYAVSKISLEPSPAQNESSQL